MEECYKMAHFAKIDENNIVSNVLVIEQEVINSGAFGEPTLYIQTSYNTYGGVHLLGDTPLRKNYAGIGFKYDAERDAFIPPQPYASWVLDEDTCLWNAPVAYPEDGKDYAWDEETTSWAEIVIPEQGE